MLTLDAVERTVANRTLFEGITWTIHPGERYGFVGPNGGGKSTLMRIVAGLDEPDRGHVRARRGLRTAYLPQEVEAELPNDATILAAVLAASNEIRAIGEEVERLAGRMAELADGGDADELARVTAEYGERRALFEWFGGDDLEARAKVVLGGLGFSREEMERTVGTFSGGWRMRALMARLLLSGADLLLLDEPTNHLDVEALAWLEDHLTRSPAALVVVSHDRVFLDRVVTRIADLQGGHLRVTPGGYSEWRRARDEEREQAEKKLKKLSSEEARLMRFKERFGAKNTKATQAHDKARMAERVRDEISEIRVEVERGWRFRWPDPPPCSDPLLELDGVGKRYGDKRVFGGVSLVLRRGERVALMGPNGAGKTTLMRIVSGDLVPDEGRRVSGEKLTVGTFAQHQLEAMDPDRSVIAEAGEAAPGRLPEELRSALGLMGLGPDHIERPVRTLSGGERARLALARLLLTPAALLLLDEPTNHLDLPMRLALEDALAAWPGTLMVVSHDRAFLEHLTNETVGVADGQVVRMPGGWREWVEWWGRRHEAQRAGVDGGGGRSAGEDAHAKSREGRRARAQALQERRRMLRPLEERVQALEGEVAEAEARMGEIDAALADPGTHADGGRMKALTAEREALEGRLAGLYDAWTEAQAELDAVREDGEG